jgi:hypothetical protein
MFDDLLGRVWDHAARDDELMYAWAERTLPERIADTLLRRLRATSPSFALASSALE